MCVTTPSTWPWIDHLVSGLRLTTESLCSNSLSLRLPYTVKLAIKRKSLTHYAKGTQSPLTRLLLFVCMRFQDLFHSPPGVLLTFPSQYWYAIGRSRVFSLGGWSPHIQTGYHVSRPTHRAHSMCIFVYGAVTLYRAPFQTLPLTHTLIQALGCSPFARRYWGNLG